MDHLQIDLDKLQQIQDSFSMAAHVFAFCVDENGKKLTRLSGDSYEARGVMESVSSSDLAELLGRVMMSRVEDQVIENTNDPNVKIACISIKVNHKPLINWIVYAVVGATSQYKSITNMDSFIRSLELLRLGAKTLLTDRLESMSAQMEYQKSQSQEAELLVSLKKSQAMTEIIKYLESEDSIESIISGVLKVTSRVVDMSNAYVLRANADGSADVVGSYESPDAQLVFDGRKHIDMPEYAKDIARTVAISSDTKVSSHMRSLLFAHGIEAIAMSPIKIHGRIEMVACYMENRRLRSLGREEIQFLTEVTHIIQDILVKRIQQNSISESFKSLERILDNVGGSIIVLELEGGKALFTNKVFRDEFGYEESETQTSILEVLKDIDDKTDTISNPDTEKSYRVHNTAISWVDGRTVKLITLYDTGESSEETSVKKEERISFFEENYI